VRARHVQKAKLETLKAIGVTRLSLGIEHFDDEILAANGARTCRPKSIALTSGHAKSTSAGQHRSDRGHDG
jgi:coproporphyrinogen III oxidase-like Fe-S oxidoreductase